MKNLLSICDLNKSDIFNIFRRADHIHDYRGLLADKTFLVFFPETSIRTRSAFEKAIYMLGTTIIRFPSDALGKEEPIQDVIGYLNCWADFVIVRHHSDEKIGQIAAFSRVPVINAMSDNSHPCEILSDLYAFRKRGRDLERDSFLFIGEAGNIGNSYFEASGLLGFDYVQVCKEGYEIPGARVCYDLEEAMCGVDVVLTDSLNEETRRKFAQLTVTLDILVNAAAHVLVNPCPAFHQGAEISQEVLDSKAFVGYEFKADLVTIQAAIIVYLHMQTGRDIL